ncbi:hypothetical protein OAI44_10040, partial [Oceanospirillaceae bacterium]|nr:hypothetical protein [Oceanospirillaceae bacterium]
TPIFPTLTYPESLLSLIANLLFDFPLFTAFHYAQFRLDLMPVRISLLEFSEGSLLERGSWFLLSPAGNRIP